jgi:hypothetical protein
MSEAELERRGLLKCRRCERWLLRHEILPSTGMCRDWRDCMEAISRIPAPENSSNSSNPNLPNLED